MADRKQNKNRKYGRNKKWCEQYKLFGTRELNKAKRLRTHCKRFPLDMKALAALKKLKPTWAQELKDLAAA